LANNNAIQIINQPGTHQIGVSLARTLGQVNLALMARTAITAEEREASVQPEEAVVELG
jgi:hypothetical protein